MTDTLKRNLEIEKVKVGHIETQLEDINIKLDNLLETINNNYISIMDKHNRLSERITILEASKEQTKYIITIISILLVALDFLLKYVM